MGRWVAVPAMHLKPYKCVACGGTPRDDEVEGRPNMQAYFCEGVDIDWGNALFLCGNCVRVLGELRGMVGVGDHKKVVQKLEQTEAQLTQAQNELEEAHDRIDRMLDGVKAKKEATAARKPTTKKKVSA
jgi:hypothetical protein